MEIILKSLASAIITAIILIIAKFSGPKLAGAIGGVPIVFAISYILLTMGDKSIARDFLVGGIYGAIAAILFSVVLILLNTYFLQSHWLNFIFAYIICFLCALLLVYFTTK
jgi:hypothetical protein